MFINTGGSYEGMDYSTMYHSTEKYMDMSPNQKYYIQMGNIDDENGPTQQYAILVFDKETDKMVYAEPVNESHFTGDFEAYQHYMAKELCEKLDWLRK